MTGPSNRRGPRPAPGLFVPGTETRTLERGLCPEGLLPPFVPVLDSTSWEGASAWLTWGWSWPLSWGRTGTSRSPSCIQSGRRNFSEGEPGEGGLDTRLGGNSDSLQLQGDSAALPCLTTCGGGERLSHPGKASLEQAACHLSTRLTCFLIQSPQVTFHHGRCTHFTDEEPEAGVMKTCRVSRC